MPRIPLLGLNVDERFLAHRQRSTSLAGMAGAALAGGLFLYRYLHDGHVVPELFAVLATMVVVKLGLLLYFRLTD